MKKSPLGFFIETLEKKAVRQEIEGNAILYPQIPPMIKISGYIVFDFFKIYKTTTVFVFSTQIFLFSGEKFKSKQRN